VGRLVGDEPLFLGDDLLPWLILALGAALVVANIAVLVRPPRLDPQDPESPRRPSPPVARVAPWIVLGALLSVWATASLLNG
jgi:hypothetical protein